MNHFTIKINKKLVAVLAILLVGGEWVASAIIVGELLPHNPSEFDWFNFLIGFLMVCLLFFHAFISCILWQYITKPKQ